MATREDPYGDYAHIKAVPLEEAARAWQVAEARVSSATATLDFVKKASYQKGHEDPARATLNKLVEDAREHLEKQKEAREEAKILLQRSAFIHPIDWT